MRIPHPATTNPRRWAAVRRSVFERDGFRCRSCGRAGRLECDHVVPVVQGGDWWGVEGLQALCRGCHIAKSRRDLEGPNPERDQWKEYRNALPNIVNGFARSDDGGGDRFLGTRTMGGFPSSLPSI